jgi:hypothetical protein
MNLIFRGHSAHEYFGMCIAKPNLENHDVEAGLAAQNETRCPLELQIGISLQIRLARILSKMR